MPLARRRQGRQIELKKKETANGQGSQDWDAALDAAFGSETAIGSLLTQLHSEHGIQSRILLRDEQDRKAPLLGKAGDSFPETTGCYRILGELARGGMGRIYKGRDEDLGREVAIKVLRKDFAQRPAMIQRFVEEAQIGGQLQHPGILPVFKLGRAQGKQIFFSMKLIQGQTLAELLEERSDLEDGRLRFLGIFEQVCQTISYAHAHGVIHRDLKPSNIMVGAFGEVQVVDWGPAKVLARARADQPSQPDDPPGRRPGDRCLGPRPSLAL